MDSYDLFGEDGGSSMLDGLTDFSGDNLDSGAPRDATGSYVAQQPPPQQQQQQQQYGQQIPQESPLQKLASFGGDFGHMDPQQQQQNLYHQTHSGYNPASARPLAPTTGPSYQPHMRSHRPAGQFTPYPPESMYAMDRQQGNLQGWNGASGYPGNMRHYGGQLGQPQASYRQNVGYPQQQQQPEKMPQQYSSSQMMGYQQYPPSSHYSGSYDNYGRMSHHNSYQQSAPQSPQYPQAPQQSQYPAGAQQYGHMQSTQLMGYHQQSQHAGHGTRPSAVDVPGFPQKPLPPSLGGASPQYRAPFPQLSPQMSPRSQMSPRPQQPPPQQQMSPRPVMSPAKPSNLSPHPLTPKSTSSPAPAYGSQNTLQQLEQMVPPYQTRNQPQTNPQSPALSTRVPLSPQSWTQPQPSNQQQSSTVESQLQNNQESMPSFHPMSTTEEAIPTSTIEPAPSEKNKTNLSLEPHSSTLLDNNCASPSESGGASSTVDSKISEPKSKQPLSSPLHSQGQLPNTSPLHQPHNSPHQSGQVSQGLSPHPSHASPHPSHTSPHPSHASPHPTPSHPSPHPSLSSPHLSPGQPLQSPHPTTSQAPQSTPASQSGSQSQAKEQENKDTASAHQMMSPAQHGLSSGHHSSQQSSSAQHQQSHQLNLGLPSSDQSNSQVLGTTNPAMASVLGNMNPHQNLPTHAIQALGSHMSTHGQIGSHLSQHMSQQHLGPSQTHMSHMMSANQNPAGQMIPPNQQQAPHLGGHGMSHMGQSTRFGDYSNPQYQNTKLDDMMSVDGRQFGSQMDVGAMEHPSNRSGRMMSMTEQTLLGMGGQQNLDPSATMRMMAGRQQPNIYGASPNAMMSGGTMMGMGMSNSDMFSHQQEMAALQQQLQELYCMPPAPLHQEKMTQLEERLRTLQQHEAATQCQGGPLCVLPGPIFGASLIQGSPQVTSTTGRGRGRGRGPAKPRKTKKQKLAEQQQQQLMEQQQMLMHQQQYRQMGYQSKGMPHEMNPIMTGTMGTMPNMAMLNNMGGNLPPNITGNPNLQTNPMQPNQSIPSGPNIHPGGLGAAGGLMSSNTNIPSGMGSNPMMSTGPANIPVNSNVVPSSNVPMNQNLSSNLNIPNNNPNMTTNSNLLHNSNLGPGMNLPGNPNMISNQSMPPGGVMPPTSMSSNINMQPPNSSLTNQNIQNIPDLGHHNLQSQSLNLPPPVPSNSNHLQTQNQLSNQPQIHSQADQNPNIPVGGNQSLVQNLQQNTQSLPPPAPPPLPPPPPSLSQVPSQPSQQTSYPSNEESLSPLRQQAQETTPSPEPPPVMDTVPEATTLNDTTSNSNPPTSTLADVNTNSNHSQPEVNTTCDVDSSTNPEYDSANTNPYDFQSSFSDSPDKKLYGKENESIDPYLMTDESLGGEVIPKKIRKPRKPREPKAPKEPKVPKEPKARKPRTPKAPKASPDGIPEEKVKSPRKRREPRSPKTAQKRGSKKRKLEEAGAEDWEALEAEEKRFFSLEDMAKNSTDVMDNTEESVPIDSGEPEKPLAPAEMVEDKETPQDATPTISTTEPIPQIMSAENPELVGNFALETPKKRGRKKEGGKSFPSRSRSVFNVKKGRSSHGRKKKSFVEESEEEGLAATPPPSPGDDGENSNKRRSARNTQRKKYCDDIMLAISDEESPKSPTPDGMQNKGIIRAGPLDPTIKPNFVYVNTTDEDSMVVQHILAIRRGKREVKLPIEPLTVNNEKLSEELNSDSQAENIGSDVVKKEEPEGKEENVTDSDVVNQDIDKKEENDGVKVDSASEKELDENKNSEFKTEIIDVDEYYVKYRNFSYLHCEWKTEEELRRGDRRIFSKIKRFQQKMANNVNIFEYLEDEPFNPDFIEIDRVLDVAEHTDPGTNITVKHYLVKWRSMQYDDSTWELEADVDPLAIKQFEKFRKIPPKDKCKFKRRPNPEQWRKLDKSPIYKNNNTLRPYQLEGLNWLLFSWHNGRNCILADEMGLGKTIQSLAFVNSVYQYGIRGPFLVIAPLSTIPNWQREFEAWTDLNVVVYHGSAASLQMIQEYEFYFKNDKGVVMKDMHKFNVLITTFELIITHSQELKGFNWRICVIDEAHRLKNRNCKLLEGLRLLNMEHRVLLSGTPLQNNVNELFSLLNFLEPSQFSSGEAFLQEFGALKTESEVNKLQAILKPMMLRRMKEDVEKSLAPKEETVVEVELTNIQKKYYRGILERNFSFLSKGTTSSNIPNLMNTMMELRKCCIHPYLLNGAEEQIQLDYRNVHGDDPEAYYKALINSSGKMVLVDKLLPKLKSNGHRVLIFSQMVKCLDILEDYLIYRKYPFERIDGRIRGDLRQAAIDRYCRPDSDRFVFLLCTKAGGLGINLTAADTVIIYDSDWNPQNDLQAQARCHRIGQQKMVKVYRLICRNTYEREMFDKASLKLGLDKAVLQSMNTSQGGKDAPQKQLSKKEIEDLLKRGAYGAIMDEDSAGDKFCEEDIDQILERRTQVITLEAEKGSTFSKASFASSGIRSDINIDDPDFWKKWAKKADIDTTEKDENEQLVVSEPRRRTQIKRYGQDDAALDMSDLGESSGPSMESDDDTSLGVGRGRGKKSKFKKRRRHHQQNHSPLGEDYGIKDGGDIQYGSWSRSECFKVEKGLLTFGWDRWPEIMYNTQFRKGWRLQTVEDCARVILVYCLRYYRGDEKIRNFIWDLITPCENGSTKIGKNHHGLSAPVPRGRNLTRSKNKNKDRRGGYESDHWSNSEKYDGEAILESNYKKHLSRHANKVLLRVRLLYYIKHEIIGDLVVQINEGIHASALPIHPPACDQAPTLWWDSDADRSLLVGTFKHGYECYSLMRNDPLLCFLARVGPDQPGQERIMNLDEDPDKDTEDDTMEGDSSNATGSALNVNEENSNTGGETTLSRGDNPSTPDTTVETIESTIESSNNTPAEVDELKTDGKYDWPTIGDLNTRLRRVITAYQKNFRKEEIKQLQKARKIERREKIEQIVREREKIRLEISQRKWSRREEVDFYRTVSVFGVEYDKNRKQYDWIKFKSLSRLEKKTDDSMTEYYNAFYTMLKRSCGLKISEEEECQDLIIEPLNEEKARKTLEVIEILSKIREEILPHPRLEQRLKLCKTSADVPDWWVPGKHDKDLLVGVAKHGIGRTDFYLLNDPELCFKDVLKMSLVDDPASFLREKFAESFKAECNLRAEAEEKQQKKIVKNESESEVSKKSDELSEEKIKGNEGETEIVPSNEKEKTVIEKEPEQTQIKVQEEESMVKLQEDEVSKNKCPAEDDEISDDEAAPEKDLSVGKPKDKIRTGKKKIKQKRSLSPKSKFLISMSSNNCENADTEIDSESVSNVNEEDEDGDDEEEYDDDDADDEDGDGKVADKSVYDFEDENELKSEKLKHDRPVRKEKEEKPEEVREESLEEKVQNEQSEAPADVKEEKPDSDEEKAKEKDKCSEKSELVDEKPNIIDPKPENEKNTDNGTDSTKPKHLPFRKHIKEDEMKNVFPELDIVQPWTRFHDFDPFLWRERCSPAPSEPSFAQLIAHSYQNPIKWPRDHAILVRLQHIIHAVEYKEWPVSSNFSAYAANSLPIPHLDLDISARNTPEVASKRDSSTPMSMSEGSEVITITTDHVLKHHVKKKKHHIAIDVETERAKLHALLNCTALSQQGQGQGLKSLSMWETADESLSEDSRRSTPVSLQPPPAHQQTSRTFTSMSSNLSLPFDLSKFHSSSQKGSSAPGTSNTLAPMDLSKTDSFQTKDTEVQDLSIVQDLSSKSKQTSTPQKGKLENTLDKLLKRKNCPPEEPIMDKEKKRRKLDAIVLGLSAAKEQQSNNLFGDSKKGSSISPSVTVTPASMHPPSSNTPSSKPFTITVTSVPTTSTSNEQERKKDNFSSFLSQAEQQHGKMLLKQQQQLLQQQQNLLQQQALSSLSSPPSRKSYEAMVADLSKVADFSKLGSYSHDAKASGSKAPSLKRLAQWLMENPMYDVDPKWAELVKERGNLAHDMQKRLPTVDRKNKNSNRPPVMTNSPESVSPSSSSVSQANLATSIASSLSFPSLATAGLGGLPTAGLTPGLLSSLSLGNFDPKNPLFDVKNNPLFDPKTNPFLDPKNHPLFDPKNISLLDPKNPLFDPKNSALFDPKNNPFFDPKNNPLLDTKNNPLFDAKNNPLLLSFGGLPNMGALGGMGPLSNSMNFFANLATLGLPSLSSLDPTGAAAAAAAAAAASASASTSASASSSASGSASGSVSAAASTSTSNTTLPSDQASPGSSSLKNKSRKANEGERHNTSKTSPVSSASSTVPNSVAGGLPFYFPNPSLLYSPLNLGALNPFTLPPGALSSAYDSLAQQCGLLNGNLAASGSGSQSSRNNGSHRSQPSVSSSKAGMSTSLTSSHGRHHRSGRESLDRHNLQHLLLPHDTTLLESLGRVSSGESGMRSNEKRWKDGDRKESADKQEKKPRDSDGKSSSIMDFSLATARTDDRPSKRSKPDYDVKKEASAAQSFLMGPLAEMDERMLRRLREPDMKEALEMLSRSHAELLAKSMAQSSKHGQDLSSNLNVADFLTRTMEEHNSKRPKEVAMKEALALSGTSMTEVRTKAEIQDKVEGEVSAKQEIPEAGAKKKVKCMKKDEKKPDDEALEASTEASTSDGNVEAEYAPPATFSKPECDAEGKNEETAEAGEPSQTTEQTEPTKASSRCRRGRNVKKGRSKSDTEEPLVVERKNLRSSAGRAARAAAERAAMKELSKSNSEKSEDEDEHKNSETRNDS